DASFVLTLRLPCGLSSGRFPSVFPTLPDPFSVPFPVGFRFRWPLEGLCLSALSDFIRSSEPDFPPSRFPYGA
ncbi:hypothetical protein, partial [Streptomyces fradiae]|uniref:hypothetical protein n=1 Tax=Streptomyces fradiae TaxID=1906 RepID=UPI00381234BA